MRSITEFIRRTAPGTNRPISLRSVLTRLLWWCMVPLMLLAGLLAVENVRDGRRAFDAAAAYLVRDVAKTVDDRVTMRVRALAVLATSRLLDDPARWGEFHAEVQGFGQVFPKSAVILASGDGAMLLHSGRPWGTALPMLPRPSGKAALPIALQTGRPAVGDTVQGTVTQKPLIAIAVPVGHGPRSDLALMTTLETQRIQQLIDNTPIPEHSRLTILDSLGGAIARVPSQPELPERDFSDAGRFSAAMTATPWSVRLEIPRSEYMAPVWQESAKLGLVVLVTSLISVVGGSVAARRLAKSVATLARPSAGSHDDHEVEEIAEARRQLLATMQSRDDALRSLGEREATFNAMFNGMPDAVLFADVDRVIRLANPAFTKIFGYQASEAIGRTSEFFYVDAEEYAEQGRRRFNATARPRSEPYQTRYRKADGTEFWCESRGMPIVGADGRVVGCSVCTGTSPRPGARNAN